jgi:hypothetical protein
MRARLYFAVLAALFAGRLAAFSPIGCSWPSGDIPLQLQLDASRPTNVTLPLTDGSATWNAVAQSVIADWNAVLGRSHLTSTIKTSAPTNSQNGDGATQVFFSTSIYGETFPDGVLAITLVLPSDNDPTSVRTVEADLIVNRAETWNSYRGPIQLTPVDLRRVLLHEMGHILGLDHPDEANPVQIVSAIMNSTISNTETLQTDDINGVTLLYKTPFTKPALTIQPTSQTVSAGSPVTLRLAVDGNAHPLADTFHSYTWYYKGPGARDTVEPLFTINHPGELAIGSAQPLDSGTYYFRALTPDDTVDSTPVTLTVNPVLTASNTSLANLSTRGIAGSGSNSMIVGFTVTGSHSKSILLRAVGPSIGAAPFNVPGTLGDPLLTLRNSSQSTVATSAPLWEQSSNITDILNATSRVGAFALRSGSRDAVILATLPPGSYTAAVSSPGGASGVVLVEAYDSDAVRDSTSRLANLSTRGFVGTDANVMIAGFIVSGPGPRTYLVRAAGDSLVQFGVTGTLDDCILTLFGGNGAQLRICDDWDSPKAAQPALASAATQVGAFPFGTGTDNGRQDSAMLVTLPPGNYTAQVSGNANDGTTDPTGVALIEIYELP